MTVPGDGGGALREVGSQGCPAPAAPALALPATLARRLGEDPEFTLQVRGWSATLVFWVGAAPYTLELRDGAVASFAPGAHNLASRTAEFRGTEGDWAALLAEIPPPLYQDFMSAVFARGFVLAGDMEEVFSRYPAIRRLLEVMRAAYNEPSLAGGAR